MKLLIVDDQLATLKGLSEEIDWKREGIGEVATARNAMEARIVFQKGVPDIMICDIEMPVENGIQLGRWVRSMGYGTKLIYLTCHSEFEYAKEALELRAVDYILQPAPYEEVAEVVRKALRDIAEDERKTKTLNKARAFEETQGYFFQSVWKDCLMERGGGKKAAAMLEVPEKKAALWLVLLQTVEWREGKALWDESALTVVLDSLLADIFNSSLFWTAAAMTESDVYAFGIQSRKEAMTEGELTKQLQYLSAVFELYMPCRPALYPGRAAEFAALPELYRKLVKRKESNVTGKSGIFSSGLPEMESQIAFGKEMRQWKVWLGTGQPEKMERAAEGLLSELAGMGRLDAGTLLEFYQEFMQMLYGASREMNGKNMSELFHTAEELELYRNGMKSLDQMNRLIRHVASAYSPVEMDTSQKEITELIKRYINSHLGENIMKEDIAGQIHLNSDYITRIFKKETGISVKSYIIQQKMLAARQLLQDTDLPISHIAVKLGYSNFSHFSSTYKKQFGITPNEEKRRSSPPGTLE